MSCARRASLDRIHLKGGVRSWANGTRAHDAGPVRGERAPQLESSKNTICGGIQGVRDGASPIDDGVGALSVRADAAPSR